MTQLQSELTRFVQTLAADRVGKLQQLSPVPDELPIRSDPLDIFVPIFNQPDVVRECIKSVIPTLSDGDRLWLVDDASDDPDIEPILEGMPVLWPDVHVIRNPENLGFVGTSNLAFDLTDRGLVVLNSDTVVSNGWLEHMQAALNQNPRAGIVCPLSDNATLLTALPPEPDETVLKRNADSTIGEVRLPTAVGFCMLVSRPLLELLGGFSDLFAPGYGEENDLSMRALKHGFDVIVADRAAVLHRGSGSFGDEQGRQLKAAHAALLDEKWPEYKPLVQAWWKDNPLRIKTEFLARTDPGRTSVVHVLHSPHSIGGTERITRSLLNQMQDTGDQVLVYPAVTRDPWCDFQLVAEAPVRELMLNSRWIRPSATIGRQGVDFSCRFAEQALLKVIAGTDADLVHFHHLLNWDSLLLPLLVREMGKRYVINLHDFYFNCPIYNQLEHSVGRPCGLAFAGADQRCFSCLPRYPSQGIGNDFKSFLQKRHALLQQVLECADAVIVPSQFMHEKIRSAYTLQDQSRIHVIPHGTNLNVGQTVGSDDRKTVTLAYFGGDQVLKGAELIIALGVLLSREDVEIRVYGRVKAFARPLQPPNVELCGFYGPDELASILAEVDLVLVPSFYEESFSMVVSESWAHGVPVLVSDRGALGERVKHGLNGWLVKDMTAAAWAEAVRKLLHGKSLAEVRKHLQTSMNADSIEDCAAAYVTVYEEIKRHAKVQVKTRQAVGESATAFDLELRKFRSRIVDERSPWMQAAFNSSEKPTRVVGVMRNRWGTAQYRIRFPLQELERAGCIEKLVFHVIDDSGYGVSQAIRDADARYVLVQPFLTDEGLFMMEQLSRTPDLTIILVIDDLWTRLPDYNPVKKSLPHDVEDRLRYAASLSHRIVMTTPELITRLGIDHPQIMPIENAMAARTWLKPRRKTKRSGSRRPRVGWAGAKQHLDDLSLIAPVIQKTCRQFDWVLMGMCPTELRPYVREFHELVPFNRYPRALAELDLDLAVAPLVDNEFNQCKSHLKLLEYGILGIPVVASDVTPYKGAPIRLTSGDPEEWIRALMDVLQSAGKAKAEGQRLRRWVLEQNMISNRRSDWMRGIGLLTSK